MDCSVLEVPKKTTSSHIVHLFSQINGLLFLVSCLRHLLCALTKTNLRLIKTNLIIKQMSSYIEAEINFHSNSISQESLKALKFTLQYNY